MALKFVKQSVRTMVGGTRVRLTKDEPWRDDDPVVCALPQFFVDEPSKVQTSLSREALAAKLATPAKTGRAAKKAAPAPAED